jgi:hypothetical protein
MGIVNKVLQSYSKANKRNETKKFNNLKDSMGEGKLSDLLFEAANRPELARNLQSEKIHVSSAINFCPRLHYFSRESNFINTSSYLSSMKVLWELGKAAELYVKRLMIGLDENNSKILGKWVKDNRVAIGFRPSKEWSYEEVDLDYLNGEITGHPDLLLLDSNNEIQVIEIKSTSKKIFKEIIESGFPLHNHAMQATFYRQMLSEKQMFYDEKTNAPYEISRTAKILYVCREYLTQDDGTYNSFLEYDIDTSKELYNVPFLTNVSLVDEYLRYKAVNAIPETKICSSYSCTTAKECPYVVRCFNG